MAGRIALLIGSILFSLVALELGLRATHGWAGLTHWPNLVERARDMGWVTGTVSRGLLFVANAAEPGILRVAFYGPMPIMENGILLNLRFRAVGKVGSVSSLVWEKIIFNDGEPRTAADIGRVEIGYSPR